MPGVTQSATAIYHLFARAAPGDLQVNQLNGGTSSWLGWTSLGGSLAGG